MGNCKSSFYQKHPKLAKLAVGAGLVGLLGGAGPYLQAQSQEKEKPKKEYSQTQMFKQFLNLFEEGGVFRLMLEKESEKMIRKEFPKYKHHLTKKDLESLTQEQIRTYQALSKETDKLLKSYETKAYDKVQEILESVGGIIQKKIIYAGKELEIKEIQKKIRESYGEKAGKSLTEKERQKLAKNLGRLEKELEKLEESQPRLKINVKSFIGAEIIEKEKKQFSDDIENLIKKYKKK